MTDLLDTIMVGIADRRRQLAPAVAEHEVLVKLLAALDELAPPARPPALAPRRRRRRDLRTEHAKQQATPARYREEVRIGVLSQTRPPAAEFEDRELAYTTEGPA